MLTSQETKETKEIETNQRLEEIMVLRLEIAKHLLRNTSGFERLKHKGTAGGIGYPDNVIKVLLKKIQTLDDGMIQALALAAFLNDRHRRQYGYKNQSLLTFSSFVNRFLESTSSDQAFHTALMSNIVSEEEMAQYSCNEIKHLGNDLLSLRAAISIIQNNI